MNGKMKYTWRAIEAQNSPGRWTGPFLPSLFGNMALEQKLLFPRQCPWSHLCPPPLVTHRPCGTFFLQIGKSLPGTYCLSLSKCDPSATRGGCLHPFLYFPVLCRQPCTNYVLKKCRRFLGWLIFMSCYVIYTSPLNISQSKWFHKW